MFGEVSFTSVFSSITLQIQNKATENIFLGHGSQYEFKFDECHFIYLHWVQEKNSTFKLTFYTLCLTSKCPEKAR